MMWLEMSRDEDHGGPGWSFTECLWSPSHKNPSGKWPFWESLLNVKKEDLIFHLRGKTHFAKFVGYSIANSNGHETIERPPISKEYSYAESYYRVPLRDFVPFKDPILLDNIFSQLASPLNDYFYSNKSRLRNEREHIFFVNQSGRLQCLNGAYLSQLSNSLASIIFGPDFSGIYNVSRPLAITVPTGQQISQIRARIGQQLFSDNVQINYNNQCCFPDCTISERDFLVSSHIARWVDARELRGEISNGLCFCLFHDKAFEIGYFTLSSDYRVSLNPKYIGISHWSNSYILPYLGHQIRLGTIKPSIDAIKLHWDRIRYHPS